MYQTIQTKFMTVKDATEIKLSSSDQVIDICKDMSYLAQESFQVLTVDVNLQKSTSLYEEPYIPQLFENLIIGV